MDDSVFFEASTPLNLNVSVSKQRWLMIVTEKHPALKDKENEVKRLLEQPEEIRKSKLDQRVYLFYKQERPKRWLCAVVKKLNGNGFLITAYLTDAIKEGDTVWSK